MSGHCLATGGEFLETVLQHRLPHSQLNHQADLPPPPLPPLTLTALERTATKSAARSCCIAARAPDRKQNWHTRFGHAALVQRQECHQRGPAGVEKEAKPERCFQNQTVSLLFTAILKYLQDANFSLYLGNCLQGQASPGN